MLSHSYTKKILTSDIIMSVCDNIGNSKFKIRYSNNNDYFNKGIEKQNDMY